MAILDSGLVFSNAQAITVTAPSTGVIDTQGVGVGNAPPNVFGTATVFGEDVGGGGPSSASPPQIVVYSVAAFTAGGAGTLQIQLQASVDTGAPGYTPSLWETILQTDTYALAQLTANTKIADFTIPRREPGQGFPRFYRLNYVVGTGPMTAGTVSAFISTGNDDVALYPAAY